MVCATPLNTRIFAGDFQFGEFRAILRGVVVKKIHNSSAHLKLVMIKKNVGRTDKKNVFNHYLLKKTA